MSNRSRLATVAMAIAATSPGRAHGEPLGIADAFKPSLVQSMRLSPDLDVRVPIVHSEKMVAALKANGKQVEWMPLPGERHGLSRDETRQRFYTALFKFLARHTSLPAEQSTAATAGPDPQR